jgi:hypothetical protein
MTSVWAGHEFHGSDLEFWAGELVAAAVEIPEAQREPFLSLACAGSERLLERTQALLAHAWDEPSTPAFNGVCQPGQTVRGCIILRPIGRGGMGEVYRAVQRSLRRLVAVKVVTSGADGLPALALEAANTARLTHPNIVAVHDADTQGDTPCIVMELVEGLSLRSWIERHWEDRQSPPALAIVHTVVRQIALALVEAHRHGLVHLDVKPENVLLTKRDGTYTVKVVDFGIARRVETPRGRAMGTPGYMAPEVVNGARPDQRADLFALGVILHELLTGRQPFAGRSHAETYFNTLTIDPAFPDDGAWTPLVAVARKALQKAPEQRYQSAEELIAELDGPADDNLEGGINPLLSEFPVAVQRWWARRSSGAALALASLLWGSASLVFSAALGAACVRVLWAPGEAIRTGYEMIFGYAVEPNAGPWYVIGTSLCILVGCAFLEAAHRGLQRTRTLKTVDSREPTPLSRVATANQVVFRYVTPAVALVAVCFVAIPELAYRQDHAFGWVQADLAGGYVGARYDDLRQDGSIGGLRPVAALCKDCAVHIAAVSNNRRGFETPAPLWFGAFLAIALGHQAVFTAFGLWIGAKVVFFFWILSTALLGGATHGLRLVPDFQDTDDYRFGLGRMDNVFYALLWLVAVSALGLTLQAAANVAKGTYFLAGDSSPALFGQAVSLLGVLALLLVPLLTPVGVFLFLNIKAVDQELARLAAVRRSLDAQSATSRSPEDRDRLRAELSDVSARRVIARKQSLLPIRQPAFLALLTAGLLMLLLLPLSIAWFSGSSGTTDNGRLFTEVMCAMSGNPQSLR